MNNKSLVKIINLELIILTDFIEGLDKDGNVNSKDIDITISKTRDIYDKLIMLKSDNKIDLSPNKSKIEQQTIDVEIAQDKPVLNTENRQDSSTEPIINIINETPQTKDVNEDINKSIDIIEELKNEKHSKPKEITTSNKEKTEEPTIEHKSKIDDLVDTDLPQELPEQNIDPNKEKEAIGSKKIMADNFSNNSPSINDMLSSTKSNKNIASSLKDSPISDLRKAIKLNDRIWYISELFNRDSETYEKTVSTINQAENLDQALEYIFNNFKWDQDKKSTISFLELVFRRFA